MKPRLTYISVFFALVVIALLLLWAAKAHQASEARIPEILGERFSTVLSHEFPAIETGANSIRAVAEELRATYPYIDEIVVGQAVPERGLIILYPVSYLLDHPNVVRQGVTGAYAVSVRSDSGQRRVGTVYFRLTKTRTRLFNIALACIVILLIAVAGVGLVQLRTAGMQVRKTRIALEEREKQLIHLERLALAGRATATLLHDLKKPVINIRDEINNIPEGAAHDALLEETRFFFDLLHDWQLERFVAPDRETGEFLDLREIIGRSLRLASFAQGSVEITMDLPDSLPDVLGQRQRLVQVFGNLFLNAYQAMSGQGRLHIRGRETPPSSERGVQIDLRDTGPGIAPDGRQRVFEAFVTSGEDDRSTGLGLYIVRSIIHGMGGEVWISGADECSPVEGMPTRGAVFHVRLPLSESETSG